MHARTSRTQRPIHATSTLNTAVAASVYCMSSSAQSLSIPIVLQRAHICISQASLHASFLLSSLMGSRSRAPYVYLKSRRRVRDHGQRTDAHDSPHSARLCGASCGCLGFLPGGHAISVHAHAHATTAPAPSRRSCLRVCCHAKSCCVLPFVCYKLCVRPCED